MIESDNSFHCSFSKFAEFNHNRFNINTLYIFIIKSSFNRYAALIITRILKNSSILLFSFLNDLKMIMFLELGNIMLLIL